jgi:hypothetical protein
VCTCRSLSCLQTDGEQAPGQSTSQVNQYHADPRHSQVNQYNPLQWSISCSRVLGARCDVYIVEWIPRSNAPSSFCFSLTLKQCLDLERTLSVSFGRRLEQPPQPPTLAAPPPLRLRLRRRPTRLAVILCGPFTSTRRQGSLGTYQTGARLICVSLWLTHIRVEVKTSATKPSMVVYVTKNETSLLRYPNLDRLARENAMLYVPLWLTRKDGAVSFP